MEDFKKKYMEEFKEKYIMLMGYLLVTANKCIQSIDTIELKRFGDLYPTDPDNHGLVPIIKINIREECELRGLNRIVIKSDIFHKLVNLDKMYFSGWNIIEDIDMIKLNKNE